MARLQTNVDRATWAEGTRRFTCPAKLVSSMVAELNRTFAVAMAGRLPPGWRSREPKLSATPPSDGSPQEATWTFEALRTRREAEPSGRVR